MRIALDYDRTFTLDPKMWTDFIGMAQYFGHEVICVTMRYNNEQEGITDLPIKVYYTERRAKEKFMRNLGITIDVWIDDSPAFILFDAAKS